LPYVHLDQAYIYFTEGDAGTDVIRFKILLSSPSDEVVKVRATTSSTSLSDWATPGVDFETFDKMVKFNPGQTSKTVKVTVFGDTKFEADEPFKLELNDPRGAVLHPDRSKTYAYAEITNDDSAPPEFIDIL
jgi:Calx-beta domain